MFQNVQASQFVWRKEHAFAAAGATSAFRSSSNLWMAKKPSGLGLFPRGFLPCKMVFQHRDSCWLREAAKRLFEVPLRLQIGNGKSGEHFSGCGSGGLRQVNGYLMTSLMR